MAVGSDGSVSTAWNYAGLSYKLYNPGQDTQNYHNTISGVPTRWKRQQALVTQ